MPEPRYFSIPSTVVGAVAFRNEALNWTPYVRSLVQDPLAWTNSPAEIIAACTQFSLLCRYMTVGFSGRWPTLWQKTAAMTRSGARCISFPANQRSEERRVGKV